MKKGIGKGKWYLTQNPIERDFFGKRMKSIDEKRLVLNDSLRLFSLKKKLTVTKVDSKSQKNSCFNSFVKS